jgi:L-threonylcarbamoyladenylate synthase
MRIVASGQLPDTLRRLTESGKCFGLLAYTRQPARVPLHALRQLPDEPEGYARGLYAALRELDQAGNDLIVVEAISGEPGWAAVADRLRRAACGSGVS